MRALRALAPDYVRLDEALTRSVDGSVSNLPLVAEVVACAEQISTRVIAAGVASEGQLEEMRRLGVHLVQGPHVGESFQLSELSNRVAALRSALPPVVT